MDISDSATKLTKLVNLLGGSAIAIDMKKIVFFDVIVVDQLHAGIVEGRNSGDREDDLDFIPREGKECTLENVDIVEYVVQWKPDEPLYKLISTKVNDIEKRNTLIVCQVRGSLASWKELKLGALFEPFIGKHGLVFVQRPLNLDTTNDVLKEIDNVGKKETTGPPSTELLFEFAGAGLFPVPHAESFTSNCFGPETFAVHFHKKPYKWIPEDNRNGGFGFLIRYDLESGTSIVQSKDQINNLVARPNQLQTVEDVCDVVAIKKINKDGMTITETISSVKERLGQTLYQKNLLESVFPNRVKIPWVKDAPHPLLQRSVSHYRGVEYQTDFHETLMNLYENHLINGKILFPSAGMVEAGLAAGAKIITPGSLVGGNEVELLGIEFLLPFEIKTGSKMLFEHHLNGGIEFGKVDSDGRDLTIFATIQQVNAAISPVATLVPFKDWIQGHTLKVPGIIERYKLLSEKGFHRGAFQSINSVWLSEDQSSVLGHIVLPTSHKHEHDGFYFVHPALLDGVFQLPCYLVNSKDQESAWVPSSISSLIMHRRLFSDITEPNQQYIWARIVLKNDGKMVKSYDIEVCNEKELLITINGFNLSKLQSRSPKASLCTARWIESDHSNNILDHMEEIKENATISKLSTKGMKIMSKPTSTNSSWTKETVTIEVENAVKPFIGDGTLDRLSNFMDMGVDSLSIVELSKSLQSRFEIEIASTLLFSKPTIKDLSEYLYSFFIPTNEEQSDQFNQNLPATCDAKNMGIFGISCHFPGGATDLESYWDLISKGKHTSTGIPFDRWDNDAILFRSELNKENTERASHGSFVNNMDSFDSSFFHISKAEASKMCPQQRVLLECAYMAFKDAGYTLQKLKGLNCGVFVGMTQTENSSIDSNNDKSSVYDIIGTSASIASGRISYIFDLHGPNSVYDTACSSSLVALNAAVSALQLGECELALVAGVNELFDQQIFTNFARAGMLSPTGRCHAWDASADGYLRGEGCGAILLKPMDKIGSGRIYATLLGTSVQSDGKSATITAPNGSAQERLIHKALKMSGIRPDEVDYIEAHGTGTSLGDPIEVEALAGVFANTRKNSHPLMVGSAKANIGHLECAAGIAGLIKAILVLQHESVPPNVCLKNMNPHIEKIIKSREFPVRFPTELEPLRPTGTKLDNKLLVAGVSSFGYSGTIAHAILRQAPKNLSRNNAFSYAEDETTVKSKKDVMFLFTGQGSQYPGMGQQFYEENKDFRKAMDRCDAIYSNLNDGGSLLESIFTLSAEDLSNTKIAQPALVSLEWSLAEMWRANDVLPSIVLGHSVGEIAAACVAGAMTIDTALHLATVRGEMMHKLPQNNGVMVAIHCSLANVETSMASSLNEKEYKQFGIASINGPDSIVLSGVRDVVEKVIKTIGKKGAYLQVSHAFHSPLMQEMEDEFRIFASSLDISSSLSVPMASTVTGRVIHIGENLDMGHWVKQLASPVLFEEAFTVAMESDLGHSDVGVVLEIGPKPVLSGMAKSLRISKVGQQVPLWAASIECSDSLKTAETIDTVTKLISREASGNTLDAVFPNRVRIPWMKDTHHPILQRSSPVGTRGMVYHTVFHKTLMELYERYFINGRILSAAAPMIEIGLAAGILWAKKDLSLNDFGIELTELCFHRPFYIEKGDKIVCDHIYNGGMQLKEETAQSEDITFATIQQIATISSSANFQTRTFRKIQEECTTKIKGTSELYGQHDTIGSHQERFQNIRELWHNDEKSMALTQLKMDHNHKYDEYYHAHPTMVHGAFQLMAMLVNDFNNKDSAFYIDYRVAGIHAVRFLQINKRCNMCYLHVEVMSRNFRCTVVDATVFHSNGEQILTLGGVRIVRNDVPLVPPLPLLVSPPMLKAIAKDVGIIAFEYYCPNLCIRATELEIFNNCKGQYKVGRGQENVTFCSDDEDAVSMAMSALARLMERCGLNYDEIGRLEVGTESQVDRAKSIKSFLMDLFGEHGCYDVVGLDTYNACYGGTNAIFNAVNWVQNDSWNGKYAIVVCTDVAVHPDRASLSSIGASAVAMLVGPHAPFVIEPERATFMKHSWDFYRPIGWRNNDAIVDVDVATEQYEEALAACQKTFSSQVGTHDLLSLFDYVVFHCNAPYHSKRSFRLMCNTIAGEELSRKLHNDLYKRHVEAGTAISAQNATTYTCPLYACLLSLVLSLQKEDIIGKRILCFAYGSGCAASMYGIRVQGLPVHPDDLLLRLQSRAPTTVEQALPLIDAFEDTHGRFGFEPSHKNNRQDGAYYLEYVDEHGVRSYTCHQKINSVRIERDADSIVTRIELMQEIIDENMIRAIIDALELGRIHVFSSACENFCLGGSAGGNIDIENFKDSVQEFAELHTALMEVCDLPIVCLCHGATRGGGMIFPAVADIVLATADASFGFPEVRRGVLPGVVSVCSRRRMDDRQCKRWMLTGDTFDSSEGLSIGFVDHVLPQNQSESSIVNETLKKLIDTPVEVLQARKKIIAANGDLNIAVVEAGALSILETKRDENSGEWLVKWNTNGVATLEFNGSDVTWDSIIMLEAQIFDLCNRSDLRALVFVVPRSSKDNLGSKNLIEQISSKCLEIPSESFERKVAIFYQLVWVSRCALASLKVPVLAVLDGPMYGFEAALALAADWRVATHDATLHLTGCTTNSIFEICKTARSLINACVNELPPILDAMEMQRLNLISSVYDSNKEALLAAQQLAITISNSPPVGVTNTMRLLRRELPSKAELAKTCVSFVKSQCENNPLQEPIKKTTNIHMVVENHFVRIDILGGIVSAAQLRTALQVASQHETPLPICVCLNETIVDLSDTKNVLGLCSWFFCKDIEYRVPVALVCRAQKVPLLLVMLADHTEITTDTTFDISASSMLMLSCVAIRHGVNGCGKLHNLPDDDLTAQDVANLSFVGNGPVESLSEGIIKVKEGFHEESPSIEAYYIPRETLIEDCFSWAKEIDVAQQKYDNLPVVLDNVAHIHFSATNDLVSQLDHINNADGLKGVILHTAPTAISEEPCLDGFVACLNNFHKQMKVLQKIREISVPTCSVIDGSITGLGIIVAMASDYRIGTRTSAFNLGDHDVASSAFFIFDLLPNVVGPTQADSLRLLRPLLNANDALQIGIVTDICKDVDSATTSALQKLHKVHYLDLLRKTSFQLPSHEISRRCFNTAMTKCLINGSVAPHGSINLTIENNDDVVRLRVGELSEATVEGIIKALQPKSAIHVFYLEKSESSSTAKIGLKYLLLLEEALKLCELPLLAVCTNYEYTGRSVFVSEADLVISNDHAVSRFSSQPKTILTSKPFLNRHVDIVAHERDHDSIVNKLLARFRKIGTTLLRNCKANLPATTLADALRTINKIMPVDQPLPHRDFGLVNLNILQSGIAVIEMNDPMYYNAMSAELMSDLLYHILEVKTLVERGKIRAVILQGTGTHFCTGGYVESTDKYVGNGEKRSQPSLELLLEIVTSIRRLPVPTLGVVHGKLIGGGVALALATDWRICPEKTTFNFGNLPRGKSPIMNLSISLPLLVGYGMAHQLYLEDTVVGASAAAKVGLVNQVVEKRDDAKRVAMEIAESALTSEQFSHGPVSRLCASSNSHAALEMQIFKISPLSLNSENLNELKHRSAKLTETNHIGVVGNRVVTSNNAVTIKIWTREAVTMEVDNTVRKVIGSNVDDLLDHSSNLIDIGLDSLSVVELSNDLQSRLEIEVSSTLIFSEPTIKDLSDFLYDRLSSNHIADVGAKVVTSNPALPKKSWTREAVTIEVDNAVRRVIGSNDNDQLDHLSNLIDIGLDSLSVVELSNDLQSRLEIEVSSTLIFSEPTIKDLSDFLYDRLSLDMEIQHSDERIQNEADVRSFHKEWAVIGISCHFPGEVTDLESYWELISKGRETSTGIPFNRWDSAAILSQSGLSEVKKLSASHGSFVNDMDSFDSSFFHISKAESASMTPQQRVLLECAFLAFKDAGYTRAKMAGLNCGVFVGMTQTIKSSFGNEEEKPSVYDATGLAASMATGRISYIFDLHGPNAAFDTACSSSLTALDAAISALQHGKCEIALVAGVNELFDQRFFSTFARAGMLSPTGRCHAWDASADGFLRGEGCGAILLKAFDATSPEDTYANIIGTSVQSDGKSATITAPNGSAQERLIHKALKMSGIRPDEVDYIEAHGTGTSLGDPIEVEALAGVFANTRKNSHPLMVGSAKANIGHLECAAGIAGLIKAILVLQHESVPPNVCLKNMNPHIEKIIKSREFPVRFPTELEPLRPTGTKLDNKLLVAGVSSFGYSGTIAHAILRQAPKNLSRNNAFSYAEDETTVKSKKDVMFLFTGQGSQYPGMGQQFYEENKDFRKAMDRCDAIYSNLNDGGSLLESIFTLSAEDLSNTKIAQPALVSLEWSLAEMWRANDVLPSIVLGHSVGEIAAACVAGAMTIDTALHLATVRGEMMHKLPQNNGVMVAIHCSLANVETSMASSLNEKEYKQFGIASINGPDSIVLSGVRDVVEKVIKTIGKKGAYLQVSHAFHSPLMQEMEDEFRIFASSLDISSSLSVPMASTVTGRVIHIGENLDMGHWVKQLASPVLFEEAFTVAMESDLGHSDVGVVLEIGPKPVLSGMAKSLRISKVGQQVPLWAASIECSDSLKTAETIDTVTKLISREASGNTLDAVFPNRVRIPWMKDTHHPILQRSSHVGTRGMVYHTVFHKTLMELYERYFINGRILSAAAPMIEIGLAAGILWAKKDLSLNDFGIELTELCFHRPFYIEKGDKIVCDHIYNGGMQLKEETAQSEDITFATIQQIATISSSANFQTRTFRKIQEECTTKIKGTSELYGQHDTIGSHQERFQNIRELWHNDEKSMALTQLKMDHNHKYDEYYHAHPTMVHGAFQLMAMLVNDFNNKDSAFYIDYRVAGIHAVRFLQINKRCNMCYLHVEVMSRNFRCTVVDATVFHSNGEQILTLGGVRIVRNDVPLVPPLPLLVSPPMLKAIAKDVGIIAFEYYCPNLCIRATELEIFNNCKGQYKVGRGQENVTFCSDDEDAVSMAMSALARLMERCGLNYDEIGRLEVGTESQVDRAKSIKSFLMDLFGEHGCYDVVGLDTYNACYGGTNAIFNAVNWVQNDSWNGKYAIVVCTDVAVHPDRASLSSIGASAVAMLVGPHAPFVIEPERATFMKHSWDFYRPIGWRNNDAIVDVDVATEQYEEALAACQKTFSSQVGTHDLLSLFDYVVFHCNAPYHAKRSFRLMCNTIAGEELSRKLHNDLYKRHVEAGTAISAQNATTYTCPLYACLLSLVLSLQKEDIIGKRILCFAYGSGCAASMYGIRVQGLPVHPDDLLLRLQSRAPTTVEQALPLIDAFEDTHGRFGFEPSHKNNRQDGAYYLEYVDEHGVRSYTCHQKINSVRIERDADSIVTRIELMQEIIDENMIRAIIDALELGRIHVFSSACENFCLGGSAGGNIDIENFKDSVQEFAELHTALMEVCDLPIVCLCHGATRGGGMIFPAVADIVLATADASFGFPEVRRGVLPGVVSVCSRRRMDDRQCKRWMLTGDTFDSSEGLSIGFVDHVLPQNQSESSIVNETLKKLIDTPVEVLQARKKIIAANGDLNIAVVEAGALSILETKRDENSGEWLVKWNTNGVATLEFNGSDVTWDSIIMLEAQIFDLCNRSDLRALVFVVPRSSKDNLDSKNLIEQISSKCLEIPSESFERKVAIFYQLVWVSRCALASLKVPVLAVLDGPMYGFEAALALAADWRVATHDATLHLTGCTTNGIFEICKTVRSLINACVNELPPILDAMEMQRLNLISSVYDSNKEALLAAQQLAITISNSPPVGVTNTMRLLRRELPSKAELAKTCVSFVKSQCENNPLQEPIKKTTNIHMVVENHFVRIDILGGIVSAAQLRTALQVASQHETPLPICVCLNETIVDLSDTKNVLGLCSWFFCKDIEYRIPVALVCRAQKVPLLLVMLADHTEITTDTTFDISASSMLMLSCVAIRHGVNGCGKLHNLPDDDLTAQDVANLSFVGNGPVESLSEGIIKVKEGFHEESPSIEAYYIPRETLIEDCFSWAKEIDVAQQKYDNLPVVLDNVAHIHFSATNDLVSQLDHINNADGLKGVILHTAPTAISEEPCLDGFVACLNNFHKQMKVLQKIREISVPTCSVIDGSITGLGIIVAMASDYRIGTRTSAFNLGDHDVASSAFFIFDLLPNVVGPTQADSLRLLRPLLNANDALQIGIVTDICKDVDSATTSALQKLHEVHYLDLLRKTSFQLPSHEISRRCFNTAMTKCLINGSVAPHGSINLTIENNDDVVRLRVGELSEATVEGIIKALQPKSAIHVFYLEKSESSSTAKIGLKYLLQLGEALKLCELPLLAVCTNYEYTGRSVFVSEADLVISNDHAVSRFSSQPKTILTSKPFLNRHVDIVAHERDHDSIVNKLLARFRKIGTTLLRNCKANLPATTLADALRTINKIMPVDQPLPHRDFGLVNLNILQSGIAVIEMNDPMYYNAMSAELMSDLLYHILEVKTLVERGKIRAVILQGTGTHFCTGAYVESTGNYVGNGEKRSDHDLETLIEIVTSIRRLPVPTLGVVHGKLIGGGVALALATDWRICPEKTTFNFGNLPRGASPMMNLSIALPLLVGYGMAHQLYLEDTVVGASAAAKVGLVNQVVEKRDDAKRVAMEIAESALTSEQFSHGPVSRLCASSNSHAALEMSLNYENLNELKHRSAKLTETNHIGAVGNRVVTSNHTLTKKVWTREAVTMEVDDTVRKVIGSNVDDLLDHSSNLIDIGLDSLSVVELSNDLQFRLEIEVSSTLIFSEPTIKDLSDFLYDRLSSNHIVDVGGKIVTSNPALPKKSWTREAVTIEVDNAVRRVIGSNDNDQLDHLSNLIDIGLDSLSVVELSNDLQSRLEIEVSSTLIFSEPTIKDLSDFLCERLLLDTEKKYSDKRSSEQFIHSETVTGYIKGSSHSSVRRKIHVPDHVFGAKVQRRNVELYEAGYSSFFMVSSNGILHEVIDSFYDDSCPTFKGNVLLLTSLNISVCTFSAFMISLKNQGFRVITIAQLGLERTQFDNELSTTYSVAERVSTNIEIMDALLREESGKPSYHVIGYSYGAACALLLALRVCVSPDSSAFLYPTQNSSSINYYDRLPKHSQECKILSLTMLAWAYDDLKMDSGLEFLNNSTTKFPDSLGGNSSEAHLHHYEAWSTTMGPIIQNITSMYSRLKIPVLMMSVAEDEVASTQKVQETASLFENSSVIIERYKTVIFEDMVQVYDFQHYRLLSPVVACQAASKILRWIES